MVTSVLVFITSAAVLIQFVHAGNANSSSSLVSIQEQVRTLRQGIKLATMPKLLPIMEKFFEMAFVIFNRLRHTIDPEMRYRLIEILEFVWNASKDVIVRWDEVKERSRDPYLEAVRYAYQTIPVFINWDSQVATVENVAFLCCNTIRNWRPQPSSPASSESCSKTR